MTQRSLAPILRGARAYWGIRIRPHRTRCLLVCVVFVVGGAFVGLFFGPELGIAWAIAGLAFLAGDFGILVKAARCQNCGILVSPAPAYRKECPVCGHIMQGE
jgi:hypothetical protein